MSYWSRRAWIKVSALGLSGGESLVGSRGPGDILGEQAALDGGTHGQSVRAVTASSLLSLPGGLFLELLRTHPGVSIALHRVHVQRLREADSMRLEQASLTVSGRVARRLLAMCDTTSEHEVPISHMELASWIGASREAVTKALVGLRRRGLVETARGRITVIRPEDLRRAAEM